MIVTIHIIFMVMVVAASATSIYCNDIAKIDCMKILGLSVDYGRKRLVGVPAILYYTFLSYLMVLLV